MPVLSRRADTEKTVSRNKFKCNLSIKYKNKFRHGYMETRKMFSDVHTALSPENINIFVLKLCFLLFVRTQKLRIHEISLFVKLDANGKPRVLEMWK